MKTLLAIALITTPITALMFFGMWIFRDFKYASGAFEELADKILNA